MPAKFESETPPKKFAEIPAKSPENIVKVSEVSKPVQEVKKPEAPKPKPEAQYQLGMSYEKKGYLYIRSPSFWRNILIFAGSVILGMIAGLITGLVLGSLSRIYTERAKDWITNAAENGHTEAVEAIFRLRKESREIKLNVCTEVQRFSEISERKRP